MFGLATLLFFHDGTIRLFSLFNPTDPKINISPSLMCWPDVQDCLHVDWRM